MPIDANYTGKYRPVTGRENKAADPTGKAVKAEEDRVLRDAVAAAVPANNQNQQGYTDRVKPLTDEVDAQIVKDRGPKFSRA